MAIRHEVSLDWLYNNRNKENRLNILVELDGRRFEGSPDNIATRIRAQCSIFYFKFDRTLIILPNTNLAHIRECENYLVTLLYSSYTHTGGAAINQDIQKN